MIRRTFVWSLVAVAVALFSTASIAADKPEKGKGDHAHGEFVKADTTTITLMQGKDKKEMSHPLAATVKVMVNGKEGKMDDVKKGDKVALTMDADKKVTAVTMGGEKKPK